MSKINTPTRLLVLPNRIASTTVNMADDMALLDLFPLPEAIRFRHYEWIHPSWTFGYSIPFAQVKEVVGEDCSNCCRRPTGGGLVHHQLDWTYSFVIPPNHSFFEMPPVELYQNIHQILSRALQVHGCSTTLASCNNHCSNNGSSDLAPKISKRCFDHPEPNDLILENTTHKVAGLALKRTQNGLLAQGSINKIATGPLPWDKLQDTFVQGLAKLLNVETQRIPWPAYPLKEIYQLRAQMEDASWNQKS